MDERGPLAIGYPCAEGGAGWGVRWRGAMRPLTGDLARPPTLTWRQEIRDRWSGLDEVNHLTPSSPVCLALWDSLTRQRQLVGGGGESFLTETESN